MAKRHLYLNGERKLVVEDSVEFEDLTELGWGLDRDTCSDVTEDSDTPEMAVGDLSVFKKAGLIEIVGFFINGDVFVQNQGDDSDRWRIPKETFEATYSEKTEDDEGYTAPINSLNDEDFTSLLENVKEECIGRGIEIAEVIPHDVDGDGEGDVDLNTLELEELHKLAVEAGVVVPHNIGKEKLIERLMEAQNEE